MKVVVFTEPCKVVLEEREMPTIGPEDILVKTQVSIISTGTEMAVYKGIGIHAEEDSLMQWWLPPSLRSRRVVNGYTSKTPPVPEYPITHGYLNAGEIVKVGEKVQGYQVGERVVYEAPHQEYYAVSYLSSRLVKIPDNISYEEAALNPDIRTAVYALQRGKIKLGELVAVLGQGLMGLLFTQIAKVSGARKVFVTDILDGRLKIAKEIGADEAINPLKEDLLKHIMKATNSRGVDLVIETVGTQETLKQAMKIAGVRGRIVIFALYRTAIGLALGTDFHFKELELLGTKWAFAAARPYHFFKELEKRNSEYAMWLLSEGKVKVKPLISHRLTVKEINNAYKRILEKPNQTITVAIRW